VNCLTTLLRHYELYKASPLEAGQTLLPTLMIFCMGRMERGEDKMNKYQVLIDSDAFVGATLNDDAHHETAKQLFNQLIKKRINCATTSLIVIETATVLSKLAGQESARNFITQMTEKHRFPVIFIDEKFYLDALDVFKQQERKRTSVVDCANVAVMKELEIPAIFSFDKVYTKDFKLDTVEKIL
jgi:predicted nucleic acid-binding protein